MDRPPDSEFADVRRLLEPRSIAVIGASERPGSFGGETVQRLVRFGFPGPVWPIGRTRAKIAGLDCLPDVRSLPAVPDLAIFAIPVEGMIDAVRECIDVGIRNGVAYTGGFAEAGGEGIERQRELTALCRAHGFMLCGPNCVGLINCTTPVTSTFATALHDFESLRAGGISMVTQSGGLGTGFFALVQRAGFGFRHLVSSGNEAVVSFADWLHALACDDGTEILAAYVEGITDGPKFVRALAEARRRNKPVVVVKSGAGKASARAAQAHTGSLVGEDRVFDAILQETGALRVYSIEELADVCLLLASMKRGARPAGRGVGISTFGGGNGVLGVDQCEQAGLEVPALRPETIARLKTLLVATATASNPMDLTPGTAFRDELLAKLPEALDVVAAESTVDSLLLIASSLAARAGPITDLVIATHARCAKPVVMAWPDTPKGVAARLAEHRIPVYDEPARAARALGRVAAWSSRPPAPASGAMAVQRFDWIAHVPAGAALPQVISEHDCHALLRAAGLPVAAGELAVDAGAAVRAAERIGGPVAMKGISPAITHRAAAGLVAIDVRGADAVRATFERFVERARARGVVLDGVYVQQMHAGGVELLVAAFRDSVFGPVVSVGAGGGMTELIDDVATARGPIDRAAAAALIGRLRIARQARDADGPLPLEAAADFVARVSALAAGAPWRRFTLEINPIKWTRAGVVAVDGLLIVDEA